jgi:hypothetical protein
MSQSTEARTLRRRADTTIQTHGHYILVKTALAQLMARGEHDVRSSLDQS